MFDCLQKKIEAWNFRFNFWNSHEPYITKKYKKWQAVVIGDEPRMTLNFKHKRLKNLGFQNHKKVLKVFEKIGYQIGLLFQITDDLIDYKGDSIPW